VRLDAAVVRRAAWIAAGGAAAIVLVLAVIRLGDEASTDCRLLAGAAEAPRPPVSALALPPPAPGALSGDLRGRLASGCLVVPDTLRLARTTASGVRVLVGRTPDGLVAAVLARRDDSGGVAADSPASLAKRGGIVLGASDMVGGVALDGYTRVTLASGRTQRIVRNAFVIEGAKSGGSVTLSGPRGTRRVRL
jgi:hypothetical protein